MSTFRAQLKKAIDAKQSSVSGIWWNLFGNEKATVTDIAARNDLTTSLEDLEKLELRLRNRLELENWIHKSIVGFR